MFDKADLAQRIDEFERQRRRLEKELKDLNDQDGDDVVAEKRWREHQVASIDNLLGTLKSSVD